MGYKMMIMSPEMLVCDENNLVILKLGKKTFFTLIFLKHITKTKTCMINNLFKKNT